MDRNTKEGRLLLSALAVITTECRTNKTPDEVLQELDELATNMESDSYEILKS